MKTLFQNIWIIDDNEIDVFILETLLEKLNLNAKIHRAIHGKQALDWLTESEKPYPELIFLDIDMPIMNGFNFLKECLAKGYVGHSKIVILSSSSLDSDKDEALMFPDVVDFVEKPPSINRLWNLFRLNFPGGKLPTLVDILHVEYPHFSQNTSGSFPHAAPIPENEAERLAALYAYRILDTPREEAFDEVVKLASQICNTPIALVSLIDKERQWFKAKEGNMAPDETARNIAFCAHTILQEEVFVVPDARLDPLFKENPLVTSNQVRFYAGAPLVSPSGLNIGSLCVIDTVARDLSEPQIFALQVLSRQIMNQIALQAKVDELVHKAEEARIAFAAEKRAKMELMKIDQVKNNFLNYMSHELRTPIHGILGITSFLNESELSDEQDAYVEKLGNAGLSLLNTVNNVLDFSKIEAGEISLDSRPFNLLRIIDSVDRAMNPTFKKRGLSLQIIIEENLPQTIIGDALRLKQVLINKLETMVQLSVGSAIVLKVQLAGQTQKVNNIRFAVFHKGPGLSKEAQKILLAPFAETSNYYDPGKGFDLGTLIVKKLIERMGGKIGVENPSKSKDLAEDQQAIFWVEIPFKAKRTRAALEYQERIGNPDQKYNILVAEDNRINQLVLLQMLKQSGLNLEIKLAQNGKEAIDIFTEHPNYFHLFLTDINMPVMDGVAAAKLIREGFNSPIPIIAMTANAYDSDKERYLSAGMNEVLIKPFNKTQLVSYVSQYLFINS